MSSPYVVEPQPPPGACHYGRALDGGVLPDPSCTPGAIDPRVTQDNIDSTIGVPGYTRTVRPPLDITAPEKAANAQSYGYQGPLDEAEYDHQIPLELGGAPNDPRNLWVEPGRLNNGGAAQKDLVENELHRLVVEHKVPLAAAQQAIAQDWTTALARVGFPPSGFTGEGLKMAECIQPGTKTYGRNWAWPGPKGAQCRSDPGLPPGAALPPPPPTQENGMATLSGIKKWTPDNLHSLADHWMREADTQEGVATDAYDQVTRGDWTGTAATIVDGYYANKVTTVTAHTALLREASQAANLQADALFAARNQVTTLAESATQQEFQVNEQGELTDPSPPLFQRIREPDRAAHQAALQAAMKAFTAADQATAETLRGHGGAMRAFNFQTGFNSKHHVGCPREQEEGGCTNEVDDQGRATGGTTVWPTIDPKTGKQMPGTFNDNVVIDRSHVRGPNDAPPWAVKGLPPVTGDFPPAPGLASPGSASIAPQDKPGGYAMPNPGVGPQPGTTPSPDRPTGYLTGAVTPDPTPNPFRGLNPPGMPPIPPGVSPGDVQRGIIDGGRQGLPALGESTFKTISPEGEVHCHGNDFGNRWTCTEVLPDGTIHSFPGIPAMEGQWPDAAYHPPQDPSIYTPHVQPPSYSDNHPPPLDPNLAPHPANYPGGPIVTDGYTTPDPTPSPVPTNTNDPQPTPPQPTSHPWPWDHGFPPVVSNEPTGGNGHVQMVDYTTQPDPIAPMDMPGPQPPGVGNLDHTVWSPPAPDCTEEQWLQRSAGALNSAIVAGGAAASIPFSAGIDSPVAIPIAVAGVITAGVGVAGAADVLSQCVE